MPEMSAKERNHRAGVAEEKITGRKWCRYGNHEGAVEGGGYKIGANGNRYFICATCRAKRNPSGFK